MHYTSKKSNPELAALLDENGGIARLRLRIAARNMFFFAEFKSLLPAFTEAGIKTILLKGVMMQGIYPPGLRPFTDIDFLKNPKGRVPRALPVGECNGVVLIHDTVIQYTALGQAKLEL